MRLTKPELSADSIIDVLKTNQIPGAESIIVSTLNRHFRRLGKDRPALKRQPLKRYHLLTVEGAHQLWNLDAHTRIIIKSEFYYHENRPCLEDTLLKAILTHGLPERFYTDYVPRNIISIEADSPTIDADIVRKSMEDEPI